MQNGREPRQGQEDLFSTGVAGAGRLDEAVGYEMAVSLSQPSEFSKDDPIKSFLTTSIHLSYRQVILTPPIHIFHRQVILTPPIIYSTVRSFCR